MVGYRVTAIVAVYNARDFLQGCFDDLFAQTLYQRGELQIIAHNGGTKHPEDVALLQHTATQPHVTVLNNPAQHRELMYTSWNMCIGAADAPYVTSANVDDRHKPDAMEKLADALDRGYDVAYSNYYCVTTKNARWDGAYELFLSDPNNYPGGGVPHANVPFSAARLWQFCHMGPQPMWRRAIHDAIGLFDTTYGIASDYEMWCRMAYAGYKFINVPEYLGLFYFSPDTVSGADNGMQLMYENWRIHIKYATLKERP
jgi:GT2 family glycosyltransferase